MKRRNFLKIAGSSISLSPWLEQLVIAAGDSVFGPSVFGDNSNADIRSLFESNREDALKLTEDVFRKCILDKIIPPTPPLKHNWVYPGGPWYKGQWIWDSMFVVDILSILPGKIYDTLVHYKSLVPANNQALQSYPQIKTSEAEYEAPFRNISMWTADHVNLLQVLR